MSLIILAVSILYAILIGYFIYGWKKLKLSTSESEAKKFSVIIPFRNEENNLPTLFRSLLQLNYQPENFEILLVNDHSEDKAFEKCRIFSSENTHFSIRVLQNEGTGKKQSLQTGIENSRFPYILTTDADCEVPLHWLHIFSSYLTENSSFLAGPVSFKTKQEEDVSIALQSFQELDFLGLQAVGAGAFGMDKPFLCNGANLCFRKQDFFDLGGYKDNTQISSGDDVFLLQKFQEKGRLCKFINDPEAIVYTNYQPTFSDLFMQRWRWAAKSTSYTSPLAILSGVLVLTINSLLVTGLILSLFNLISWKILFISFLIKANADFILISISAKFFKKKMFLQSFWWCSILYPFFGMAVAFSSALGKFTWKGRTFKK